MRSGSDHQRTRVNVEYDVEAVMRDGTVLRSDVVRPDSDEICPVLLCRTPYGKRGAILSEFLDAVDAAQRGFIVVLQDVRGRGRSDGHWSPFLNEFDDGADTVRWAGSLPGSSGDVGMFGPSYLGFTQWAAACEQPEPLRALVPALTWADATDGLLSRGGTPEVGLLSYLYHYGFATDEIDYDAIDALAAPVPAHLPTPLERTTPPSCTIPHDRSDPAIRVPALNIAGWYDVFCAGTLDHHKRAEHGPPGSPGLSSKLIIGPWSHINFTAASGTHTFGERASLAHLGGTGLHQITLDWFDHWLRHEPLTHPWLTGPAVRSFDVGTNRWNATDTWPPPTSRAERWRIGDADVFQPDTDANDTPTTIHLVASRTTTWSGGAIHMHPTHPAGVVDQHCWSDRSGERQFTSDLITSGLTLAGPVRVHVSAKQISTPVDLVARLSVEDSDDHRWNLADGVRRLTPGTRRQTIDLWSTHATIGAGQRLHLTLALGGWPRWGEPTLNYTGVELTVDEIDLTVDGHR